MSQNNAIIRSSAQAEEAAIEAARKRFWKAKTEEELKKRASQTFGLFRSRITTLENQLRARELLCLLFGGIALILGIMLIV